MTDKKPVLIALDDAAPASPADAPPVPDPLPRGQAMQTVLAMSGRRSSAWGRLGWSAAIGLITLSVSVSAWDFVTGLLSRNPTLGYVAAALVAVVALAGLGWAAREVAGFRRLRRVEELRKQADTALGAADRAAAMQVSRRLLAFYGARADMHWSRAQLAPQLDDQADADGVLGLTESVLMAPLDTRARAEIESAARQVAALTAMLPLPLIDVIAALVTNLRMIRRIAEIYGGRTGGLGSLRLVRGVVAHLLATGAIAVGEDMLGSVAGGGVVSKLSRRFGEGVVNAALTARLGIAATEVCRPLPYRLLPRPRTGALMGRAVSGLFDRETGPSRDGD